MRMLFILVATTALGAAPADEVRAALADVQSLPAASQSQARYLSLYNVREGARREKAAAAVSYLVNSVSRSRWISVPQAAAGGRLLRIDLAAYADAKRPETYGQLHAAWEQLAADDPYFHLRTQIAAAGRSELKTVSVDAGWLDLPAAAELGHRTGSFGAVLRADYFVARVASTPAYYEWSGVPERQADFFKELGLDLAVINKLAADSAANLFRSGVTGKPRRVIFRPGPLGGNWVTKDVAREAPDKDPLRNPINFREQRYNFDASEVFYARANRMWGTALFNAAGVRQDAVPVEIATDTTAPAGHQQLVPLVSCIRCHELNGGRDGLQPFADDQTQLALPRSPEPAVERRIAELYDPARLAKEIRRNREDYADAVAAATGGLAPDEAASALAEVYAAHVYQPVTRETAAAELGLAVEELVPALEASPDPITLAVRGGREVNRKNWEASFQDAILLAEQWSRGRRRPSSPRPLAPRGVPSR